jgi:hypothetical protein
MGWIARTTNKALHLAERLHFLHVAYSWLDKTFGITGFWMALLVAATAAAIAWLKQFDSLYIFLASLAALAMALLIANQLRKLAGGLSQAGVSPHADNLSQPANTRFSRAPFIWLFQKAWDLDLHKKSGNTDWIIPFADALRQAALDGDVGFWGRPKNSQIEEVIRREPLSSIPSEHWKDFEIDVIAAIEMTANGSEVGVMKDNFYARSTGKIRGTDYRAYTDLHVHRESAERWLREWATDSD